MSDYRDPRNDPLDPTGTAGMRDSMGRSNSGLGWIAGAIFLVVVLALIFGLGRQTDQSATNTGASPPATTGAAPPSTAPRTTTGQGAGGQ
jgi:hypothetical protein